MNSIHLHEQMVHQPREKRLKVSRACSTCRVKKIKCDGVQPCMQCKARKRPCSFSKNGHVDQTQPSSDDIHPVRHSSSSTQHSHNKRHRSVSHSPKPESHKQPDATTLQARAKEQDELRKSTQQLDKLSMMWPGEGKEGRWLVDINLLFNGAEENNILHNPSPPIININANLLNLFFRHRYTIFPILPKSIFYRLLEHRDPFIINSLLLYSMYCNAAHFSHEDASEADNYYKKAQVLLLDTYVDTPSLSTVISLCLLSTFESNRYGVGPYAAAGNHRSRIYSDMAFRMCHDLKLHKRYSSFHHHQTGVTPDDNELRKRVYWACYCLDKVHSLITGRPFFLSCKDIDIDFPMVLRSDDYPTEEYEINTCFVEHIKLMQIAERVLQLDIIPDRRQVGGIMRSPENEQTVLDLDQRLLYWLRNLPQQLQWTPLDTDGDVVPTQPPSNALIAHLHLVYNYVEISVLQPLAFTSLSSTPASLMIQQRCASVATNLTQLTCAMADQPNFIMSFTLASEAIMAAVRIHIMDCADEKLNTARHARFMFQRSLRSLRSILHHRVIDRIQDFITTIERTLVDADTGNSSSRNSSPKIHILSPVIPRTTSIIPQHQPLQDHHANTTMDERWSARFNATTTTNNNNSGLYPYGLISPASSTASAPVEKSNISRDESSSLSYNMYNHSTSTIMDPYYSSSRATNTTSFTIPSSSTPNSWRSSPIISSQQLSPIKSYERPPNNNNNSQQQMEMYSNIWSKPTTTTTTTSTELFPSSDHLDNSFLTSTTRQRNKEQSTTMNADADLYSLWDQQQVEKNNNEEEEEQQVTAPIMFTPQQTGRYGLGVYASAQQHHTDVICQHMPEMKSLNLNRRPVLLNHHGQVVVAPNNNNDTMN